MIDTDPRRFLAKAQKAPADLPPTARAALLVAPDGMTLAKDSAKDNRYMRSDRRFDVERALRQHRGLQAALADCLPTLCFPGRAETPDAVFPNNVFATARVAGEAQGRFLIGRMKHASRQRETERADIRRFFAELLGYRAIDLRRQAGLSELTGTLVIDRARGIGFAGLGPRCDLDGALAMHEGFGLRATLAFELAEGEYHANVVLALLAGRTLVLAADAVPDATVREVLHGLYAPTVITLDSDEAAAFAGNCIALDAATAWMSETAADALRPETRAAFKRAGWRLGVVALDELEKAGGSLRCCVAEIF